jgi:transcriptional regulator with XRE-family HTH domain
MSLKRRIGVGIRTLRLTRRLTQEDLAARSGLTVQALSNIENGKSLVSLSNLEMIARALDVSIQDMADLLGDRTGGERRVALELRVRALCFALSDTGLEIAARQIEALVEFHARETPEETAARRKGATG